MYIHLTHCNSYISVLPSVVISVVRAAVGLTVVTSIVVNFIVVAPAEHNTFNY